ncbi:MAG: hypothetical protein KDD61_04355 [Bdellovibrionales bacterium]|nr:hypothetical protein [Bdellovibrionales bacterium]
MEFIFAVLSKNEKIKFEEVQEAIATFQNFLAGRTYKTIVTPYGVFCGSEGEQRSVYEFADSVMWRLSPYLSSPIKESVFLEKEYLTFRERERLVRTDVNVHWSDDLVGGSAVESGDFFLQGDDQGLIPLFFGETDRWVVLSSFPEVLTRHFTDLAEVNLFRVAEFLRYGFLTPGSTLFKNLKVLGPKETLKMCQGKLEIQKRPQREDPIAESSLSSVATRYLDHFSERLALLLKGRTVEYALLTGGSDTRLILAALTEEQRRELQFVTFYDPIWSANRNDVDIAVALAKKFNLRHEIRPHSRNNSYVEAIESDLPLYSHTVNLPAKLCGTFGSETIGGAAFWLLPSRPWSGPHGVGSAEVIRKLFRRQVDESFKELWSGNQNESGADDKACSLPLPLRSTATAIYADVNALPWQHPYQLRLSQKLLPFLGVKNLRLIQGAPEEYLRDYKIQKYLFLNVFPEYLEVPFQSRITYEDERFLSLQWKGELVPYAEQAYEFLKNQWSQLPWWDGQVLLDEISQPENIDLQIRLVTLMSILKKHKGHWL